MTKEQIIIIAKEYGRNGVGATELAKRFGVSKQNIHQMTLRLRNNGVDIPNMNQRDAFYEALNELKTKK